MWCYSRIESPEPLFILAGLVSSAKVYINRNIDSYRTVLARMPFHKVNKLEKWEVQRKYLIKYP